MTNSSKKAVKRVKKHPDAIAWEKWLKSEEGQVCSRPITEPLGQVYVENRLWHAFMAGRRPKSSPDNK